MNVLVYENEKYFDSQNSRIEYAIYSDQFLNATKAKIESYASSPPDGDPFHITRVFMDADYNRVNVYSYDWTDKTVRQFRQTFGLYSEPVIFLTGPWDEYVDGSSSSP